MKRQLKGRREGQRGHACPPWGLRSGCGGVRDGRGGWPGSGAAPQAIKHCWEPGVGVDIALRNRSAGMSFPGRKQWGWRAYLDAPVAQSNDEGWALVEPRRLSRAMLYVASTL